MSISLRLPWPGREDEAADKGARAAYKDMRRKKRASSQMMIHAPISLGELIDKITILQIKMERIKDQGKRANVSHELQLMEAILRSVWDERMAPFRAELKKVNELLWDVEDELRLKDRREEFDQAFVELAKAVYVTNDQRAALKLSLNNMFGSAVVEEKSYAQL